jgi:copper transport protein
VALGAVRWHHHDPLTVTAPVPLELSRGEYRVVWQTGSRDGHIVSGEISFLVDPIGEARGDAAGRVGGDVDRILRSPDRAQVAEAEIGRSSPVSRLARWLEFASLLAAIGVVAFVLGIIGRIGTLGDTAVHAMQRRARNLGIVAAASLAVMSLLRLLAESRVVAGTEALVDFDTAARIAFTSSWGWGWTVAMLGTGLALAGFIMAAGRVASGWRTAAAGVVIAAVGPALTGHAIGSGNLAPVAVLADYVHVMAAGLWLGTLLSIAVAALPVAMKRPEGDRAPAVAALISAFHPFGVWGVSLLVGSGVVSALIRVRTFSALTTTNYGELLLFKVYIFLFAGVIGAYNFMRLLPRIRRGSDARRFRTFSTIELAIGLTALALTAILVATGSPA